MLGLRKGEQAEQLVSDGKRREGELPPVLDLGAAGVDGMTLDGPAVIALVDLDRGLAGWRTFEDKRRVGMPAAGHALVPEGLFKGI